MKTCLIVFISCSLLTACTKDKIASDEEGKLYQDALNSSDYAWYKNDPSVVASSGASGHSGFMRVRFNTLARSSFDSTGKLPDGSSFPEGSIVVKELFNSSSTADPKEWAVMKKTSVSNSGAGWLWAEFDNNGAIKYSTSLKGAGCISCHSAPDNRDYVRVFEIFP